ncbi:MAG: zinc metalloprotease HtpX [Candidatus Aminicenantes bacterium]|nr:zinc metalloprotease HtpX [Candidatus Aminicenantes bacterium]
MEFKRHLFWEIQKQQKRLSLLVLFSLFLFYFLAIGLLTLAFFLGAGLFFPDLTRLNSPLFLKYLSLLTFISFLLTSVNFWHARRTGASFILNRLQAYPPAREDRYHLTFLNVLEEMKLASGLRELKGYIIPSLNINSFSLIERDGHPAIGITEGLLAEASRDELQAVVAHETAHLLRGDTELFTLICSLASFFEQLLISLEKEREGPTFDILNRKSQKEVIHPLLYLAGLISYALICFLNIFISRQRELLADSTAVELGRDPMALARIIYKAQLANSYLGDFSLYTPLFLVSPDSRELRENFWTRLFNPHPPAMKRLKLLTSMANKSWSELIQQVKEQERRREKARIETKAQEERPQESEARISSSSLTSSQQAGVREEKIWMVKGISGRWDGPYTLNSLLALPSFSPGLRIKNIRENREGKARDFALVRQAFYRLYHQQPIDSRCQNQCPHCLTDLIETFYEGVKIKTCLSCQGKLVHSFFLEKIMARREIGFTPRLKAIAEETSENLNQPKWLKKRADNKRIANCPHCGLQMVIKPYNYVYPLPVYKCFHCSLIWFEADELEVLQFLLERQSIRTRLTLDRI